MNNSYVFSKGRVTGIIGSACLMVSAKLPRPITIFVNGHEFQNISRTNIQDVIDVLEVIRREYDNEQIA